MAIDFSKMIIKSAEEVYLFNKDTDTIKSFYDEVTSIKFTGDSDEKEVSGANGAVLAILDSKKKLTTEFTNAYYTTDGLATVTGGEADSASESNKFIIRRFEYVKLSEGKTLTLKDTPITKTVDSKSTSVVVEVDSLNSDKSIKEVVSSATVSGKVVTLTGGTVGDIYRVVYDTEVVSGVRVSDNANEFAGTYRMVANLLVEDPCDHKEYYLQADIPSLKVKTSYAIEVGDNPATMTVTGTAIKDICSSDGKFAYYTLIG